MLNPTTHKSDTCPQATFPILEHSLASASTLTPQEKQKLLELLKEFDDVFLHSGQKIHYYLDNGLIASPTFEQHLVTLRKMFECLRKAKLMLGHKKSPTTEFLGHTLFYLVISLSVDKLRAVKNFPQPKNAKQVKSFIGLASYYRHFLPGFSQIAHSLYELTKQNVPFHWSDDCEIAFQTLKDKLCTAPVLISPDTNLPFHIFLDASKKSVGLVLMQKKNCRLHPIAYGSKILLRCTISNSI